MGVFFIRGILAQVGVELHGCAQPSALVRIDRDKHRVALAHRLCLLAVGEQKVLGEPPVQECADAVHLRYRKRCDLPKLRLRQKLCGDGTVLGILVDKYGDNVAGRLPGKLVLRKQDAGCVHDGSCILRRVDVFRSARRKSGGRGSVSVISCGKSRQVCAVRLERIYSEFLCFS